MTSFSRRAGCPHDHLAKQWVLRSLNHAGYRLLKKADRRVFAFHDSAELPARDRLGRLSFRRHTSRVGDRRPVSRGEIGEPIALFIIGQSNGGNHGATPFAAAEAVFNFNLFDGLCYRAATPFSARPGRAAARGACWGMP
jgi:hypothetical protein